MFSLDQMMWFTAPSLSSITGDNSNDRIYMQISACSIQNWIYVIGLATTPGEDTPCSYMMQRLNADRTIHKCLTTPVN